MLFINNEEVQQVLTTQDTIRVLEEGHRELARMELVARPRVDIYTQTDQEDFFYRWGTMEGSSKGLHRHAIRLKSDVVSWRDHAGGLVEDKYASRPGLFCGLVMLFDTNTGVPLAIINDGYIAHLRVGASAAIGVKYLARQEASTVGMLGSGWMARSHLMAFKAVRDIKRVKVYSPTKEHREEYAREMSEQMDIEVIPVDTPEEAVKGVDILSACTNTRVPLVFARMLEPGMHFTQVAQEGAPDVPPMIDVTIGGGETVNQIFTGVPIDQSGGVPTYLAGSAEALDKALGRARQSRAPTREPGGGGRAQEALKVRRVPLLDLMDGKVEGRLSDDEISASRLGGGDRGGGQGLQFVTAGSLVFDAAKRAGLGREVPTEWFLQDIRD